ncbi:MAG TPA: hypothetical protein PLC52_10980 [Anaerolineales bacterium]|nr:hypothetical protein [Anaerolineales bacterium]HRQ93369.1 hypothetical protein [Anaerolineales bacterium]
MTQANNLSDRLQKILGDDNDLVNSFFLVFTRFEFALKAADYKFRGRNQVAYADWNKFAQEQSKRFDPLHTDIKEAYGYLDSRPPKIQIIESNELCWKDNHRGDQTDLAWCIHLVKTVRNNLFHGGKFPYHQTRDHNLLTASLDVIAHLVNLNPEVEQKYMEMTGEQAWYQPPY